MLIVFAVILGGCARVVRQHEDFGYITDEIKAKAGLGFLPSQVIGGRATTVGNEISVYTVIAINSKEYRDILNKCDYTNSLNPSLRKIVDGVQSRYSNDSSASISEYFKVDSIEGAVVCVGFTESERSAAFVVLKF